MSRLVTAAMVLAITAATLRPALACDTCKSKSKPGTYLGAARMLGNGTVYSWVTLDEKGKPSAMGITMTETALTGLPATPPNSAMPDWEYALELPKEAGKTGFDHIGLNWNPSGHSPQPIYGAPHFDVHFYLIGMKERERITAKGDDLQKCRKPLPSVFTPTGYIYASGGEAPEMGAHWIDPKSPEFGGKPFTKTFIYGSYEGRLIFLEPMLTKAFLESRPNVTDPLKLPEAFQKSGYYPARYTVRHDPVRQEYVIALEGLKWHEGVSAEMAVRRKTAAK